MASLTQGSNRLREGAIPVKRLAGVRHEVLLMDEVFEFPVV